jgi:hypothetical protein
MPQCIAPAGYYFHCPVFAPNPSLCISCKYFKEDKQTNLEDYYDNTQSIPKNRI